MHVRGPTDQRRGHNLHRQQFNDPGVIKYVSRKQITVITNSLQVLYEISRMGGNKNSAICVGGMYNAKNIALYDDTSMLS